MDIDQKLAELGINVEELDFTIVKDEDNDRKRC